MMKLQALFKDSFFYGLSSVFSRGGLLVVIPLYVVYLTPEEFGFVSLSQLYIAAGIIFFLLGMDQALLRYFPKAPAGEKQTLFSTAFLFLAGTSIFFCSLMFLFKNPLSRLLFKTSQFSTGIVWLLGIIAAEGFFLLINTRLQAEQRAKSYLANSIIKFTLFFLCNWILLKYAGMKIEAFLISCIVCNLAVIAISIHLWHFRIPLRFSMDRLVQLLKFGLPLAPGVLATILLFQADQYLLQRYHNLETVGKYGFGYRFGAVLYTELNLCSRYVV